MTDFDFGLYYRITRLDNQNSVIVKRDAAPPQIVSGGARWSVVDRPRRVGFTVWEGSDPYRMDVPILIDGWDDLDSMENTIAFVNQLKFAPSDFVQPPQVRIEGALPVRGDVTWVVEERDFGDNVIWHEDNYRVRQDMVLHLLQYHEAKQLSIKAASTSHMHTVKTGETLKSISKDEYGTSKYWSAIQKANNIRDPKKLPNTLRIPPIVSPSG